MLSLVAYDNSDDSGSDSDDGNEKSVAVIPQPPTPVIVKNGDSKTPEDVEMGTSTSTTEVTPVKPVNVAASKPKVKPLFLPSTHLTNLNFDLKILDKNRSQPIRITIPSLKDLSKEEEPVKKPKIIKSTKGCGLFSLLPPPKNVTSAVSRALTPKSVSTAKNVPPKSFKSKVSSKPKKPKTRKHNDEDNDEPLKSFFFSEPEAPLPPIEVGTLASSSPYTETHYNKHPIEPQMTNELAVLGPSSISSDQQGAAYTQSFFEESVDPILDDAALIKLCGSRERKKGPDLSEIIEISGSSLMGDSSLLLAKDLSKEQPTHSFKRRSDCSSIQRRKHQITFLAEQGSEENHPARISPARRLTSLSIRAKAQELELRNNWAQNRMTRKQTQAKYGF